MPIKPADEQQLNALYAEHKGSRTGRKEDYFALLYLKKKFGADPEQVAHQVAFGNGDYGIDAYYLDRPAKNLYLFQFKWTEDHRQFKGSMERLAKDGMARIFGNNNTQDPQQSDILQYLRNDLSECREIIDRVYLHFVFKGDLEALDKSESMVHRREDLEGKIHLLRQYFGERDIDFQIDFISDRPGRTPPPKHQTFAASFRGASAAQHDGRTMLVGFIPLMDLHAIHKSLGQQFFDRNIRAALSADNAPNRKIREALDRIVLKESEEPSVFAFRHNGVTIAADKIDVTDERVILHVPRLLNGAQTVSSLLRFLEQHEGNQALRRNRSRLEELQVVAKLVEDDPSSDFVTQVTIANNQQNPVHPWMLRAMDRRQVDLADKFREEVGIYYSRQEGAFENLSDEDLEELGVTSNKDIRIKQLALTFLAIQGDIANMGKLPDVFETQKTYEGTFKASYLHVDARAIVLAYKTGQMLGGVMRRLSVLLPQKLELAVPKAKNLAWALLLQGLLNAPQYQKYLADYGSVLTKEGAFSDVLIKLANTRVAPLIKTLCGLPTYQQKVLDGKFDFLRSTEAYKKAMDLAYEQYDWKKKSF